MKPSAVVSNYYKFRGALASAIGLAILLAGVAQVSSGMPGSDIAWFLIVFAVLQYFALRIYRKGQRELAEASWSALVERMQAKNPKREAGPVLGKICADCTRRIVVEDDGARCGECSLPLHDDCRTHHQATAHQVSASTYR
jgi:hypothetical protein